MKYYELPVIAGTTEQQIEQIKNYLYLQNEALNYNLEQSTAEKVFEQAQQAMVKAVSPIESEQVRSTYQAFRDLIIGTAEEAFKVSDSFTKTLKQLEAYRSAFGTFTEEIERQIGTAPSGTTDLYSYIGTVKTTAENAGTAAGNAQSTADNAATAAGNAATAAGNAATAAEAAQSTANGAASYITKQVNFIKSGYLDTTANPPVFGIEIGMLESSYTEELDGQSTTIQATPEKIRITPGRISFITGSGNSETEAAYISNGAVYFPNAQITGGSISIGSGTFQVSSAGALTATSATISGTITAGSGSTFGGWTIGSNAIYRGSETFDNANTLYFGSSGLSIKDKFKVDSNGNLTASGATLTGGSIKIGTPSNNVYPFEVSSAGAMTCTSATIGGWTVTPAGFYQQYTGGGVAAYIGNTGITFGSNSSTSNNYSAIGTNGVLTAYNALIRGTIYAGAGEIGGWTIASDRIEKFNSSNYGIKMTPGSNPRIELTEQDRSVTGLVAVSNLLLDPRLVAKDSNRQFAFSKYGVAGAANGKYCYFGSEGLFVGSGTLMFDSSVTLSVTNGGDNHIKVAGYMIQWGKVNASLSSGSASGSVAFSPAFSSTPAISHSFNGSEPNKYLVKCDPNTSAFAWAVVPNGGTWTGTVGFTWIAIGKA